jgi:DNA-binding transcriptional regulator of glucitol operon
LSEWWWTVDRLLLAAFITLMLGGVILSWQQVRRWRRASASIRFTSSIAM